MSDLEIHVAPDAHEALKIVDSGYWMRPGRALHAYQTHYGKSKKFVVVEGDAITEDATLAAAAIAGILPVTNASLIVLGLVSGLPGYPAGEIPDSMIERSEAFGETSSVILAWRERQKIEERQDIPLESQWLCAVLDWHALLFDSPYTARELAQARAAELARRS